MNEQKPFIVDENLLGLVKRLRMMGVDTIDLPGATDDELLAKANEQSRLILTKDRRFFQRIPQGQAYFVTSETPEEQLFEVLRQYPLLVMEDPLSRCFRCNSLIEEIQKQSVVGRVDAKTFGLYDKFYECPTCHQIYWEGSHFEKMQDKIQKIKKSLG